MSTIPMHSHAAMRTVLSLCLIVLAAKAKTRAQSPPSNQSSASMATKHALRDGSATEKLVWADEFNSRQAQSGPDRAHWIEETGRGHWGNHELQTYCAYGSNLPPCSARKPNLYVGRDGYLHVVARKTAKGVFTSARIKSQGMASFQYGRMEARIRIPSGDGMWPAFWMLGDSIQHIGWPKCGEFDIMENIGKEPATIHGSIHGQGFTGTSLGFPYASPGRVPWSQGFHTYGLIWSPGKVEYYVDRPSNIYAMFTPASLPPGAVWPFDQGKFFFILNLAVGGDWPGPPDQTTRFPDEMLVDYVRVWQRPNPAPADAK